MTCLSGCFKFRRARPPLPAEQALLGHASAPPLAPQGPEPAAVEAFVPPTAPPTATVIISQGTQEPSQIMQRGGLNMSWVKEVSGVTNVRKYRERPARQLVDESLALPTLYLHFLKDEFLPKAGDFDWSLRAGNDNEEVRIVLPTVFTKEYYTLGQRVEGEVGRQLAAVLKFLMAVGEPSVSPVNAARGSFGPEANFKGRCCPNLLSFPLRTARPKASISLDKPAFGIPQSADIYLFAQNHVSVAFMDEYHRSAFESCIEELPNHGRDLQNFTIFLQLFYQGGFAYNKKIELSGGSYLPETVGIACMNIEPAFEGQLGISTGYPYLVEPRFFPFVDTVPVTIRAICKMSPRHQRYGLCFTRCVFAWEGEEFADGQVLDFLALAPHGGFFYVPKTLGEYWRLGALVYAFGEDKNSPAKQRGEGPAVSMEL